VTQAFHEVAHQTGRVERREAARPSALTVAVPPPSHQPYCRAKTGSRLHHASRMISGSSPAPAESVILGCAGELSPAGLFGGKMSVYKVVEVIGTSSESWEAAAIAAVNKARERFVSSVSRRSSSRTSTWTTVAA
jgi:hypothetical protein